MLTKFGTAKTGSNREKSNIVFTILLLGKNKKTMATIIFKDSISK